MASAVTLTNRQQLRLLALIAGGIIAIVAMVQFGRWLLTPRPQPTRPIPADAFQPTREQLAQLTIAPVRIGANATLVRANGSIAVDADHSTPIVLPFSGQVVDVFAEPGQAIVRGQPLLSVASPDLVDARNTLLTTAAQAASAAEAVKVAEQNAARQKAIYETAGGALKDYLQAQADLVTAQSGLRAAQSALRAARDRLGLFGKSAAEIRSLESPATGLNGRAATVYRAPVSGIIADRNVSPGQFLSAGGNSPLLTITDLSHVWLVAQLPESDAASVQLGDDIDVTTPAIPGRVFHAKIDNIGAALDPNTHRLPVRATVENPGGLLKPQMFASFTIRRALTGSVGALVPASAVIHEGDSARVWVLGSDGLLHGRNVTTADTEGGLTRITHGLAAGDRVVTSGALFVNEAGLNQ
jgi:cobalt-zinc-cadmium efflux system membrane fusion protein